jgi:hypothetical protein
MSQPQQIAEPFWYKLLFLIVGALIGAVATYFGAVLIAKKNRRLDANAVFYEAFRKAIRDFQSRANPPTEPQHTLSYHIEDHRAAAYRFRFFLKKAERQRFMAAWEKYYQDYQNNKFADNGEQEKRREKIQLALDHIYNLLTFAGYEKID